MSRGEKARIDEISGHLNLVAREIAASREKFARQLGIHPTDFACVSYLHRHRGTPTPREINAHLGLSSGSGTALLDRLERAGYLRRISNQNDRRSVLIELDRAGAAQIIEVIRSVEAQYTAALSAFSDTELDAITRFLATVAEVSRSVND